jgi:hypothetical protein
MSRGKVLQFPLRNRRLFSREINAQVLSVGESSRILYAAIRALPHVRDWRRRDELKRALCDLLLNQNVVV